MIVHNLKIRYYEDSQLKEMFFALDDNDLIELRKVLDRAENKSKQLAKIISKCDIQHFQAK
jgi:hypothetical protein